MNRWSGMLAVVAVLTPAALEAQKPSNNVHTRSAETYLASAEKEPVLADRREFLLKALEAALAGTQAAPTNPRSWYQAGVAYMGLKDFAGADSAFDRAEQLYPEYATEIDPQRQAAWIEAYNAGVTALQSNNVAEAVRSLQQADMLYRKRPEALVTLGSLYVQAGELDKGAATFRSALEVLRGPERGKLSAEQAATWQEDELATSLRLANIYVEQQKLAEAEQVYRDLLKSQPGNTAARASLARVLTRAGKADEAAAAYRELLEEEDLSEATLFNIGIGLYAAQEYDRAAKAFQRTLALNPVSHDALYNLAQSLFGRSAALETGKAAAAGARQQEIDREQTTLNEGLRTAAEQLLALDPTNRNGLMMLAQAQRSLGALAGAGAEGDRWRQAALATLEKHKALPFEISDINVIAGEGSVQIMGKVTNLTATAGSPLAFRFSAIDRSGTELVGSDVTVTAPATGESVRFDTRVAMPEGAAGWKYVVK